MLISMSNLKHLKYELKNDKVGIIDLPYGG